LIGEADVRKLLWRLRGPRLVRLHLEGNQPSVEGLLLGRWGGHYVLREAKIVQGEQASVPVEGSVEVPEGRVLFAQVLGKGVR